MNTQTTTQSTITIGGMACSSCANAVEQALNDIDGVQKSSVDLDNDLASVSYDANAVSAEDFEKAIDDAGYEFLGMKN